MPLDLKGHRGIIHDLIPGQKELENDPNRFKIGLRYSCIHLFSSFSIILVETTLIEKIQIQCCTFSDFIKKSYPKQTFSFSIVSEPSDRDLGLFSSIVPARWESVQSS